MRVEACPSIPSDETHVWFYCINGNESPATLSPAEQERAARFRFPIHRSRYIAAHVWMRRTLAGYCSAHAAELVFEQGEFGKPYLCGFPIHFNLSHSGDHAMLAVSPAPVGADIEQVADKPDLTAIARRFFTGAESQALDSLPPERRTWGFYRLWTFKEALLKATGEGLAGGINSVDLSRALIHNTIAHGVWRIEALRAPNGFAAAVCHQSPHVRCFTEAAAPAKPEGSDGPRDAML
ncbi:MAG: 4'-phosphopantetheinyl transferase superfamily protein [Bryobacterales bacterium]|nr:4'-phosphopantetheinyl transferase superfamily protein [Bryobacterales bacterium]